MRFVAGPRQAGKTTLARQKLQEAKSDALYYLWDLRSVRERYKENELFFTADGITAKRKWWVCFDEIHKMPKWKNILKAIFDETGERYQFIITGSAKLNIVKRAGDSLAGRYFTFHLMPLVLRELTGKSCSVHVPVNALDFVHSLLDKKPISHDTLCELVEYSGFPEPFLRQTKTFQRKWSGDYLDSVIREDIGSLTRIVDRESIYDLYKLLPEMVGSPLSESSIASHLQISPVTAKNYLKRLADFYLAFTIRPYSRNIKRSLLRAGKCYLYDWSHVKDAGARFENYVACELNARLLLWEDATGIEFRLFYVRNKDKQETDFLILRERQPWMLVECKLSDGHVSNHHCQAAEALGKIPVVQVCMQDGIAMLQKRNVIRISSNRFFA